MGKNIHILIFLVAIFCLGLVFAVHTNTPTTFSINTSENKLLNITIANGDSTGNITQVNFTLPSSLTFVSNSQGTNASGTFSSSGLSWTNESGLILNQTSNYFYLNVSAGSSVTIANITITSWNGSAHSTNLSVNISDGTAPSIIFGSSTPSANSNLSQNYIYVNVSSSDNAGLGEVRIYLWNSSLVNNTNFSVSGTSNTSLINFTSLAEGIYYINMTANDTSGNQNLTSETRRITLDRTNPSVSLSENNDTQTTLNITISVSDSTSGWNGTCTTTRGSVSGRYVSASSLSCGTEYQFNVTCWDYSGNSDMESDEFSTESCDDSDGGSGGGESGFSWSNTVSVSESDFAKGYSRILGAKERLSAKIGGSTHYVGVISLTSTKAKINVSSTPQQKELSAGEELKVDVDLSDGKNIYDLLVKVISVNSSKTNISISPINESYIPSNVVLGVVNSGNVTNSTNKLSNINSKFERFGKKFLGLKVWIWLFILIVVIVIVGIVGFILANKDKKPGYGF